MDYKDAEEYDDAAAPLSNIRISKNSSRTALHMALARFMVISAMHTAYPSIKAESEDTAKM